MKGCRSDGRMHEGMEGGYDLGMETKETNGGRNGGDLREQWGK